MMVMPIRAAGTPLTPEEHAQAAWEWLREQCAPSTWAEFTHSVAVRQPQVREWP